jgi:protein-tyrosine phosphatase
MDTTEHERRILLQNVHNFRDLGGYPTEDGRTTRWRVLFRADALHRLDADELDQLRPLGIRTVIDLRSPAELALGRFPVEDHPVSFHHLPVVDAAAAPEDLAAAAGSEGYLLDRYVEMLARGRERISEAVAVLAADGSLPAVFHCTGGKDRTGILAGLVLSSLGVPDDVVVADYALTGEAMDRLRAWYAEHEPAIAQAMDSYPPAVLGAEPGTMAGLLAHLREVYGSPRGYLLDAGVPEADLTRLEARLLEG